MIPATVRIFVCTERQDMRKSFDGLALAVQERLELDPQSGALFVFAGKRGNRLKVLWFQLHRELRAPAFSSILEGPPRVRVTHYGSGMSSAVWVPMLRTSEAPSATGRRGSAPDRCSR